MGHSKAECWVQRDNRDLRRSQVVREGKDSSVSFATEKPDEILATKQRVSDSAPAPKSVRWDAMSVDHLLNQRASASTMQELFRAFDRNPKSRKNCQSKLLLESRRL